MEALLDPAVKRRVKSPPRAGPPGLRLTPADLETYLDNLSQQGRGRDTLATYRRNVHALYDGLPEDKTVRPGTLDQWREALLEGGYSPRTVNVRISVANSLMAFLGRRDLQSVGALEVDDVQPELTRTEYLRLLTTARALDKERLYLLVKLFGCTGIPLQELPRVTVEALTEGRVVVRSNGVVQLLHLPDFLRKELYCGCRSNGHTRRHGHAGAARYRGTNGLDNCQERHCKRTAAGQHGCPGYNHQLPDRGDQHRQRRPAQRSGQRQPVGQRHNSVRRKRNIRPG